MPDYGLDTLSREDLLGPAKAPAPVAATPTTPKAPAVDYGLGAMSTQDLLGGPVDPTAEAEKAAALFEASFKDPTEEVKRRNLSKSIEKLTGIFTPAPVMDVKDSERAFRLHEADHATRASPRTSAFLSIQENADVAMQDAKTLAQIERVVRGETRALVRGAEIAAKNLPMGLPQIGAWTFDLAAIPPDFLGAGVRTAGLPENMNIFAEMAAGSRRYAKSAREAMDYLTPTPETLIERGVTSGARSAGMMLALAPAQAMAMSQAVVPGATAAVVRDAAMRVGNAVAGWFGVGTGAEAFTEARDKGKGVIDATTYAIPHGAFEYLFEIAPSRVMAEAIHSAPGLKAFVWDLLKTEVPGEQLTTLSQNFNTWANLNPNKPAADFLAEQPGAMAETFIATLVGAGLQAGAVHTTQRATGYFAQKQEERRIEQQQQLLTDLFDQAKQIKADPVTFQNFMAGVTDNTTVFINAEELRNTLAQNQMDSSILPSLEEQLSQPSVTGDVEIPIGELMTAFAGTPAQEQVVQHARIRQDDLSAAEQAAYGGTEAEFFKKQAALVMEKQKANEQFTTERAEIEADIVAKLQSLAPLSERPFNTRDFKYQASLLGAFYATAADLMGTTPKQVAAQWAPKILGTEAAPAEAGLTQGFSHGNAMLNVGLDVGATDRAQKIDAAFVEAELNKMGVQVLSAKEVEGEYEYDGKAVKELTYVPQLSRPLTEAEVNTLAIATGQEAIGHYAGGVGNLWGPNAANWGDFNPEFFKDQEGVSLSDAQKGLKQGTGLKAVDVNSPEFKAWFGDSKVVTEGGKPLRVYHGTKADIAKFDASRTGYGSTLFGTYSVERHGIFVTPSAELANDFAAQGDRNAQAGGNVVPLYASIKNPIDMTAGYPNAIFDAVEAWGNKQGLDGYRTARNLGDMWGDWMLFDEDAGQDPAFTIGMLKALGYDGVKFHEGKVAGEGASGDTYIAFHPEQIKSAISNTGAFRNEDPNILAQSQSSRRPTTKRAPEDHLGEVPLTVDYTKIEDDKNEQNMALVAKYPGIRFKARKAAGRAEEFIQHVTNNILWLHDQIPADIRQRSKLWYDGARAITDRWTKKYGKSDSQIAAVLAIYSPQKDWFMNVSLAERTLDIVQNQQNTPWSAEMSAVADKILADEKFAMLRGAIEGKKLSELKDRLEQAAWLRTFDEAHNNRGHRLVTPEGGFVEFAVSTKNVEKKTGWPGFGTIIKALYVLDDGSPKMIDNALGAEHKVRSFYNNIFHPTSDMGFVTIDTHAVAAGLLRPLSGNSVEVTHNFGGGGTATSAATGMSGTYAYYQEAYRRAAEARGLLPREMQSIAWEAVRELYTMTFKHDTAKMAVVDKLWSEYEKGKRDLDSVRAGILNLAGGVEQPAWVGHDSGISPEGWASTYTRELLGDSIPRRAAGTVDDGAGERAAAGVPAADLAQRNVGAVAGPVVGIHYSQQPRTSLASSAFGSGMSGAERERLAAATDPRIKQRVAFYVNTGNGITPESGVGPHAHEATLRNLYDADADSLKIWRNSKGDMNAAESAVLDAGFDGYLTRNFGGTGAVVMLGSRSVAVQGLKKEDVSSRAEIPPSAEIPKMKQAAMAIVNNRALPFGQQSVESWKRDLERTDPDTAALIDWATIPPGDYYKDQIAGQLWQTTFKPVDTESAEFKAWARDAEVLERDDTFSHDFVSEQPVVVQVIHGTTGDFVAFDKDRATVESDMGAGIYATNDELDASANYAGEGPDLTNRLEYRAEQIESFLEDDDSMEGKTRDEIRAEAKRRAREELAVQNQGFAMPVWMRFEKPFVLGGPSETQMTYEAPYDEETDEYGEETGTLVDFIVELRSVAAQYSGGELEWPVAALLEKAADGVVSATELFEAVGNAETFFYFENNEGQLVSKEIIRQTLENLGYDGIIDQTVDAKFGSSKKRGQAMRGVTPDTKHFIVFSPKQIKSAISNTGEFSDTNPNILFAEAAGPRRGSFNPLTFDLRLLADANRSTFIHELSHFFMAAYIDMASQPDAPPALTEFVENLLGYLFEKVPGGTQVGGEGLGQQARAALIEQLKKDPNVYWHGSPSGDLRGGHYGLHLGSYEAAKQALEARIGTPLEGEWDGTREYGKTMLAPGATGYEAGGEPRLPTGKALYSDGTPVAMDSKPNIVPFRITGKMTNTRVRPHEDFKANGYMKAAIKKGNAKSGYFYTNEAEDYGSISVVVPSAAHLQRIDSRAALYQEVGAGGTAPGAIPEGRTNLERWNAMTLDQQRAYWEFFAEGFEQYAMTGKAPTKALQSAFNAFAKWMKEIYKTLVTFVRQHGTKPLDAELTQFFDRMLATDEELDAARQERGFQALFKKAAEAGMSPGQFADYMALDDLQKVEAEELLRSRSLRDMKWLSNAKTKAMKELQAEADELRALVQASVEEELASTPIRQAERWLRKGEMVQDGEQIKAAAGHRLDTAILKAMFPEGAIAGQIDFAKLGRGSNALASTTGTQHPDDVAAIFGFRNGEDLVRQLIEMQPFKEEVQQLTDLRMLEEHGDLASPQAIAKAADEAIHNDAHLKMVATEVWALSNRTGSVAILTRAAKAFAAQLVGNTVVKKLSPSSYANAATRAGKAAVRALAKKEVDKAANEKRTEMVNAAAAKAAYAAEAEVRAIVNRLRKISAYSDKHSATTSREFGVVQAVRAILSDFGIGQHGEKATKYLNTLSEYDPVLGAVLDDVINKLAPEVKPWDQLKVADLRELHAAINGLWTVARDVRSVELAGEKMSLDDARAQLIAKLEETQKTKAPTKAFSLTKAEERNQDFMSFAAKAIRPESWISTKDGLDSYGPWRRLIWNTIDRAELAYNADKTEKLKQLKALLEPIAADMVDVKIDAPELGGTFGAGRTIGYSELLHAILHTGNQSNKTKLLVGRGWGSLNEDGTLNSAKWDTFMARMFAEGRVTKAHMDFVQATWDLLESMKKGAQEAHKATTGRYFEEIEATPLVTPYGTYRGGYAPAIVDHQLVAEADLRKMQNAAETEVIHSFEKPAGGFTKSRVAGYNQPLELNIAALGRHIDQVLLFSHMSIPVRNVQRVLKGKDLSSALAEQDRAALGSVLAPWLHSAATQTVTEKGKLSYESLSLFTKARSRAGAAIMFANVSNSVQQLTGFFPATLKVSKKELLFAAAKGWYKPRELAASVAEMSPYMQQRLANEVHAMAEEIDHVLLNPTRFEKAQDWAIAHSYFLQMAVDTAMSPIIWQAKFNEETARGAAQQEAVDLADAAVRMTQGTNRAIDIAAMEKGSPFYRMFMQFAGYFNTQANLVGEKLAAEALLPKTPAKYGRIGMILAVGWWAPAIATALIVQLFRGGVDDDDQDGEWLDDWLVSTFIGSPIRYAVAAIPVFGTTINAAVNSFNNKPYDDRISMSPAVSLVEGGFRGAQAAYGTIEDPTKAGRAIRDLGTFLSLFTGVPVTPATRAAGFATDVETGKVSPTSGADYARGIITGVASPESKR